MKFSPRALLCFPAAGDDLYLPLAEKLELNLVYHYTQLNTRYTFKKAFCCFLGCLFICCKLTIYNGTEDATSVASVAAYSVSLALCLGT